MLDLDREDAELRRLLQATFDRHARDITTASGLSAFAEHFVTETQQIMKDLASTWNTRTRAYRLPDEVLACSFALLPGLRDRLSASHVCRSWRQAALSFPSLWTDIEFSSQGRDPVATVDTLLSRTGQLPVTLTYRHFMRDPAYAAVCRAVEKHMQKIASITWHSDQLGPEKLSFTVPAPLLHTLSTNIDLPLSGDFLGGGCSSLRTLRVRTLRLPTSCPALATVETLKGEISVLPGDGAETISGLFRLFPRLKSLWLGRVDGGVELPEGPVPSSLVHLTLSTRDKDSDLAARYLMWRTPELTDVELIYETLPPGPEVTGLALNTLFREATELSALPGRQTTTATISLRDGAGVTYRIRFSSPILHAHGLGSTLRAAQYPSLRKLNIDLRLFDYIAPQLPRNLRCLTLHVSGSSRPFTGSRTLAPYPWELLEHLGDLARQCPDLESVTVDVRPVKGAGTPSARNARDLLESVRNLSADGSPAVRVQGFTAAVVAELTATAGATDAGLSIVFDTQTDRKP